MVCCGCWGPGHDDDDGSEDENEPKLADENGDVASAGVAAGVEWLEEAAALLLASPGPPGAETTPKLGRPNGLGRPPNGLLICSCAAPCCRCSFALDFAPAARPVHARDCFTFPFEGLSVQCAEFVALAAAVARSCLRGDFRSQPPVARPAAPAAERAQWARRSTTPRSCAS